MSQPLPDAAPIVSADPYAPLRVPNYRLFVAGILTMALGAQIQGVVVAWQMYALTHDPLALGMVGLAEAAPFIGLALYAGHVADVHDRRRVALIALAVLAAAAVALAVASRGLGTQGRPTPVPGWLRFAIYAIIVVCGAARSFLLPSRNALGAELIPRALYPSAVAWRTGVWQVAAVTGPAAGGLLYAWVGATASYAFAAALDGGRLLDRHPHSGANPGRRHSD